ncbi:hypothetical protein B0T13DRAFT_392107 [Neurospora crassa]|nr:hypothetical protein B0T13DRAFT_392107 [Neurospora crassa]
MPTLKDREILTAIATAPSSTVRSVLRTLCAHNDNKRLIGKMISQLPLTPDQVEQNNTKKRKAVHQEICVQCGCTFERGDESLSCRHHPYDMELDHSDDKWCDWPDHMEIEDTPNNHGKRGKYQPSKTKSGIFAALEELEAKDRKERAEQWVPKRDGLNNEQLVTAIALALEDTVRAVLRALTADDVFKSRIATLMAKLPLGPATTAAGNCGESNDASKKRKASTTQICVQCDELFEEDDTSETCSYHPYTDAPGWIEWPRRGIQDTEIMRRENPDGFVYPCCEALGSEGYVGCTVGRHRASDGKRGKFPGSDGESYSGEEDKETEEEG